ncbi:hypothetical protein BGW38_004451 [Lunasporangiospora selenospora]|uniref:Uncharacterized protein n=1 Tax=Lunasporangiospora selenospora TaxID=979761 RepID=A0A9P6G0F8_9FUNG|nr:hypothetical protein BGW38_004451 [Lunasporangiospora selenospora]
MSSEPRKSRASMRTSASHNSTEYVELAHEQEPTVGRCWILSAIVLFLSAAAYSVPNVLSANQVKEPARPFQGDNEGTRSIQTQPHNLQDTTIEESSTKGLEPKWASVGDMDFSQQQHENFQPPPSIVMVQPPLAPSPPPNTADSLSAEKVVPSRQPLSSTAFANSQSHRNDQPGAPPQNSHIWPIIQAMILLSFRIIRWSLVAIWGTVAWTFKAPVDAFVEVSRGPYEMMRDICKAFLPVYSFFTIAAIIGIVVGGSATWIAQLLMAAVGADQDKKVVDVDEWDQRRARSLEEDDSDDGVRYHGDYVGSSPDASPFLSRKRQQASVSQQPRTMTGHSRGRGRFSRANEDMESENDQRDMEDDEWERA